jgi:hypothetical protein
MDKNEKLRSGAIFLRTSVCTHYNLFESNFSSSSLVFHNVAQGQRLRLLCNNSVINILITIGLIIFGAILQKLFKNKIVTGLSAHPV